MAKLLLVEDNEMNRDMLSRRLERKGHSVVCAASGEQAVQMTASEQPELILMDMSLPVLDGWEATKQIKPFNPRMPIMALTAHAIGRRRAQGSRSRVRRLRHQAYRDGALKIQRLLERQPAEA